MSSPSAVRVELKPKAGFCVKTSLLRDGSYVAAAPGRSDTHLTFNSRTHVPVPKGLKVFINIAWDSNVPPPPEGNEDKIRAAISGEAVTENDPDAWFVPLVVPDGRGDKDKAGRPSIVFDAIYNVCLKSRSLREPMFKLFLIELALQRVELQNSLVLSREIATPKLPSKGSLEPRTVSIPTGLYSDPSQIPPSESPRPVKLIEEISSTPAEATRAGTQKGSRVTPSPARSGDLNTPSWTWDETGPSLLITIQVPKLTREHMPISTLDLESRRLLLSVPSLYALDIDLTLPDAELTSAAGQNSKNVLMLKRKRAFDVDAARAEWRVTEGVIVVFV